MIIDDRGLMETIMMNDWKNGATGMMGKNPPGNMNLHDLGRKSIMMENMSHMMRKDLRKKNANIDMMMGGKHDDGTGHA